MCLVCASVNQVTLEQTVKQVRVASCLCGNTDHNYARHNATLCAFNIPPCSTVSCYQRDTSRCNDGGLVTAACRALNISGMSLPRYCLSLLNKVCVLHHQSYYHNNMKFLCCAYLLCVSPISKKNLTQHLVGCSTIYFFLLVTYRKIPIIVAFPI